MPQARAPLILNLPEQAWFDVQLMHKDIRLALETSRRLDVAVPSAAVIGPVDLLSFLCPAGLPCHSFKHPNAGGPARILKSGEMASDY